MAEVLGIIPARGGSKSIPRKNICSFLGKPLISWSIEVAKAASRIDRVVVSTDDEEIASIALRAGAEVPFIRPTNLGSDHVTDYPVIRHCIDFLSKEQNYNPELVVQFRPTSPLRTAELVDDAISKMVENRLADSLRVVCESPANPYKMWRIKDEFLEPLIRTDIHEQFNQPRQALPITYWQIGTLDVIRTTTILGKRSLSGEKIIPYVVDPSWICDIDDQNSLARGEYACQHKGMGI